MMKRKTTTKTLVARAAMMLLMLLTTATAWAWDGQGTEADPYLITNTTDLSQLANNVLGGTPYTGTYFKLTADITYTHSTEWRSSPILSFSA